MASINPLPLGLRLRRARRAAKLSQAELARRANVSQPLVSYYERATGDIGGEGLEAIAAVLGISLDPRAPEAPPPNDIQAELPWLGAYRSRVLASLAHCGLTTAFLDRAASTNSGDLALAIQQRSHVMFAVIDGTGSGDQAAVGALIQTASVLGGTSLGRGVVWPDELLEAVRELPALFGVDSLAASFVAQLDTRHGMLTWASERFPAPLLRSGARTSSLRGERKGDLESGRIQLKEDWMLLIGTDGMAHALSRGGKPLWDTRDVQQLLRHAAQPQEIVDRLAKRLPASGLTDDAFALVVSAP